MAAADYRLLTDATGQRMAAALEGMSVDRAAKTDLTSIIATGTTNQTGAAITTGTYFYLNGTLVQALTNIASGATFTSGTNYEAVTAGGLNSLYVGLKKRTGYIATEINIPANSSVICNYSDVGIVREHTYILLATGVTNTAWRYVGVLFLAAGTQVLSKLIGDMMDVSASAQSLTLTNQNTEYSMIIKLELLGYQE